ncbi:MAG: hypothetical protein IJT70_02025 [Clostridia bacterium]|nr:hypothetical protein [Lachnospiraceae bacterium]MBQ7714626.1 hypothetical protein [Clostridia bacterium]
MKPVLAILIAAVLVLALGACGRDDEAPTNETSALSFETVTPPAETTAPVTETETPASDLPQAGLYLMTRYEKGVREDYALVTGTYDDDLSAGVDLCVFAAYPSLEPTLSGRDMAQIYSEAAAKLQDGGGKIGFTVSYEADGKTVENRILGPADIDEANLHYLEIYLYDDVNQAPGAWYSHLLPEEVNDETLLTSIKLTPGKDFAAVKNLRLSSFYYTADAESAPYTLEIRPNPARTN